MSDEHTSRALSFAFYAFSIAVLISFLLIAGILFSKLGVGLYPSGINYVLYFLFVVGLIGLFRGVVELYSLGKWRDSPRKALAYTEVVSRTSNSLILIAGTIFIIWVI